MTGFIKSDRLVTRVVAVILSALVALSMMFAFGGTSANAVTVLTTNGGKSLKSLLSADISGYSSHFSEYGIKTLAQKFDFKSKGMGGELRKDQVFVIQSDKKFTFNGAIFEDIDDSSLQQDLIRCFAKEMAKKSTYSFSDSDRQAIYNEIKDGCGPANAAMVAALFSDTKADMFSALNIFAPFNGIVGTLLGIAVRVIIILLMHLLLWILLTSTSLLHVTLCMVKMIKVAEAEIVSPQNLGVLLRTHGLSLMNVRQAEIRGIKMQTLLTSREGHLLTLLYLSSFSIS